MARGTGEGNKNTLGVRKAGFSLPDKNISPGDLIVLCGLPGIGKSTYLNQLKDDVVVVNLDDLRGQAPNSAGDWDQSATGWAVRAAYKQMREHMIESIHPVVLDATGAARGNRVSAVELGHELGKKVHMIYFPADTARAHEQNKRRGLTDPMREVPGAVIDRMAEGINRGIKDNFKDEGFDSITKIVLPKYNRLGFTQNPSPVVSAEARALRDVLLSDNASKTITELALDGSLDEILPELVVGIGYDQANPHHSYTLFEHTMCVLAGAERYGVDADNVEALRWAALLHDIGKPGTRWDDTKEWVDHEGNARVGIGHYYARRDPENPKKTIGEDHEVLGARMALVRLRELGVAPNVQRHAVHLIRHHMFREFNSVKAAKKHIVRVGDEIVSDLFLLRLADRSGKPVGIGQADLDHVDKMKELIKIAKEVPGSSNSIKLAIGGKDLIKDLKVKPGPIIGELMSKLHEAVSLDPRLNTPEQLLRLAQSSMQSK